MNDSSEQKRSRIEYWIEAGEEDLLRDQSFGHFLKAGSGVLPLRNFYRHMKGDRRPFTCDDFLDELGDMKLLQDEWGLVDYADALEPGVGFHVEVEETDEDESQLLMFEPERWGSPEKVVTLAFLPAENTAVVRAPAALKESSQARLRQSRFLKTITSVVRERRLAGLYGLEWLEELLERADSYPYIYNKAVFEKLSHIAAGHPIPIADSDDYFWPQNWPAKLPPLRHLPKEELSAINVREAQLRAEWLCIMSSFKEVVFTNSLFH